MEESNLTTRRNFLRSLGLLTAGTLVLPDSQLFASNGIEKLTILHTNDVHSRIDPFPMDGSRNAGLAGAARRAAMIKKIRQEEKNVLLLDAGDMFQGTPYFNLYQGELEFKLMSAMGYDACTLGNHDFDLGVDGLVKQLPHAKFPLLVGNYNVSDSPLHNRVQAYKVFKKAQLKIGVFGLGIELQGLVEARNHKGVQYLDPIQEANKISGILKNDLHCDLVICLSHLGYKYKDNKVSDQILAKNSSYIDLILGGHTHTFMNSEQIANAKGEKIQIFQVGFAGINLGRIDYYFESAKRRKTSVATSLIVDHQADEFLG